MAKILIDALVVILRIYGVDFPRRIHKSDAGFKFLPKRKFSEK